MGVVGNAKLTLGAEHQDQDARDLAADEVDQQQVVQCLLGGAELGVGRDLEEAHLRSTWHPPTEAARARGESVTAPGLSEPRPHAGSAPEAAPAR
jgi:hypothetical protein